MPGADALQTFATARRYLSCGDRTIFSEVVTWCARGPWHWVTSRAGPSSCFWFKSACPMLPVLWAHRCESSSPKVPELHRDDTTQPIPPRAGAFSRTDVVPGANGGNGCGMRNRSSVNQPSVRTSTCPYLSLRGITFDGHASDAIPADGHRLSSMSSPSSLRANAVVRQHLDGGPPVPAVCARYDISTTERAGP